MKVMRQHNNRANVREATRRAVMALCCAGLLGGFVAFVPAPVMAEVVTVTTPVLSGGGISADEAAAIVRRRYDGRVISVSPVNGGKGGYKVRVLLDGGRVKTVHVDKSGRIR